LTPSALTTGVAGASGRLSSNSASATIRKPPPDPP
jgi:hypothetical protein